MQKTDFFRFVKKLVQGNHPTAASHQQRCHSCDQELVAQSAGPYTLSRCPGCQGTWLSSQCLAAALCEKQARQTMLAMVGQDGEADIAHTFAPSRLARQCPSCTKKMENHKFEDSGIWIDTCPEGHGVWLDRGELKLLDERQKTPIQPLDADLEDAFEDTINSILFSSL